MAELQGQRLRELGAWLKINGEGIYFTRPWSRASDGELYFTQSKNGDMVYIICLEWPGKELRIKDIRPVPGSEIRMLGRKGNLKWIGNDQEIKISLPANLQNENKRPCKYGWVFKVQVN